MTEITLRWMRHETQPDSDPMGMWEGEVSYYFIYDSKKQIVAETNSAQRKLKRTWITLK